MWSKSSLFQSRILLKINKLLDEAIIEIWLSWILNGFESFGPQNKTRNEHTHAECEQSEGIPNLYLKVFKIWEKFRVKPSFLTKHSNGWTQI